MKRCGLLARALAEEMRILVCPPQKRAFGGAAARHLLAFSSAERCVCYVTNSVKQPEAPLK